jgi:hypothetical protein
MREVLHGAFSANKLTDEEIEKKNNLNTCRLYSAYLQGPDLDCFIK